MENLKKEKEIPQRNFTTVAQYKEFMENPTNDDRTKQNNPVPKDGKKLSELLKLTDEELVSFINEIAKKPNKSDRRKMFADGYGFTWADLKVIAKYKGFYSSNESSNTPRYRILHEAKKAHESKEIDPQVMIEHGHRNNIIVKKFTISEETNNKINNLIGEDKSNQVTSKIIDVMLSTVMDRYIQYKDEGRFEVRYKAVEEKRII